MSGDPEQEYFSDGIADDIITELSRFHWFFVVARNSSFTYKGRAVDVKQVARDLGVKYVLEGSVRKAGDRVRITAQLIDAETGNHLWAERYDRQLADIFEMQDEISHRIASILGPELHRVETKRAAAVRPKHLNAWDCCLRGMALLDELTAQGNAQARKELHRAVEFDPDYGEIYVVIARSYLRDVMFELTDDRIGAIERACSAAQRAVDLDPASSAAHVVLSSAYQYKGDQAMALEEARLSVKLNPNDPNALRALGNKLDLAGDESGIAVMEKAQQLDPLTPDRHFREAFLARAYVNSRDYDKAVSLARSAVRWRPSFPNAHFILGIALAHQGAVDEAKAAFAKCDEVRPGFVADHANWQPYATEMSNRHLQDGLRKVGLRD
jgi:adenylate cyclase